MLILAQQYKIELMIQIGNQKQPSPVIEFWRERMRGLSPKQMIAGLRSWQSTGSGNFQPTPESIREWAEGEPAPDAPKAKTNPGCVNCGGTGFRYTDGRKWSERDSKSKTGLTKCDCAVVVYRGTAYKSATFQLVAAPADRKQPKKPTSMDHAFVPSLTRKPDCCDICGVTREEHAQQPVAVPEIPPAKAMPSAYAPSNAELERKKKQAFAVAEKLRQQAEKLMNKSK